MWLRFFGKPYSKVKVFSWTIIHQRLNTNEMLELRRPHHALSPDVCVLCLRDSVTHSHLFLHCNLAWKLWTKLFRLFSLVWVLPPIMGTFISSIIYGVGLRHEAKPPWQGVIFAGH